MREEREAAARAEFLRRERIQSRAVSSLLQGTLMGAFFDMTENLRDWKADEANKAMAAYIRPQTPQPKGEVWAAVQDVDHRSDVIGCWDGYKHQYEWPESEIPGPGAYKVPGAFTAWIDEENETVQLKKSHYKSHPTMGRPNKGIHQLTRPVFGLEKADEWCQMPLYEPGPIYAPGAILEKDTPGPGRYKEVKVSKVRKSLSNREASFSRAPRLTGGEMPGVARDWAHRMPEAGLYSVEAVKASAPAYTIGVRRLGQHEETEGADVLYDLETAHEAVEPSSKKGGGILPLPTHARSRYL